MAQFLSDGGLSSSNADTLSGIRYRPSLIRTSLPFAWPWFLTFSQHES